MAPHAEQVLFLGYSSRPYIACFSYQGYHCHQGPRKNRIARRRWEYSFCCTDLARGQSSECHENGIFSCLSREDKGIKIVPVTVSESHLNLSSCLVHARWR